MIEENGDNLIIKETIVGSGHIAYYADGRFVFCIVTEGWKAKILSWIFRVKPLTKV